MSLRTAIRRLRRNLTRTNRRGRGALWSWQLDPEAAAFAEGGFEAVGAAHALGGAGNDGEADAGAFVHFGANAALEDAEDFLVELRRNANALVADPDANLRGHWRLRGWALG